MDRDGHRLCSAYYTNGGVRVLHEHARSRDGAHWHYIGRHWMQNSFTWVRIAGASGRFKATYLPNGSCTVWRSTWQELVALWTMSIFFARVKLEFLTLASSISGLYACLGHVLIIPIRWKSWASVWVLCGPTTLGFFFSLHCVAYLRFLSLDWFILSFSLLFFFFHPHLEGKVLLKGGAM